MGVLRRRTSPPAGDQGTPTIVERLDDLRFGEAPDGRKTKTPSWSEAVQPRDGDFDRDRSMFLRASGVARLLPTLGAIGAEVDDLRPGQAEPFTAAALADDDLVTFESASLFLDPNLIGHSVDGLRLALEALGLDRDPRARGVYAVALDGEIGLLAMPDAYHRCWTPQAIVADPETPPPARLPPETPIGFHVCTPEDGAAESAPSAAPEASPPSVVRLVLDPPTTYDPAPLRSIFTAVADLCAARADLVATLSLPRHATLADAHRLLDPIAARPAAGVDVMSYVGVWHPWPSIVEARSPALAPLRRTPPDGVVCGTIAASERDRGVWIEPAGRPFAGILSVDTVDTATELALFDARFNVMRRRPSGFVATSAHSLSSDASLLQLSTRRLLIWLRKLSLREGTRFVFAADDERFRAQIAALFQRHLNVLKSAGALVAYEVVVADVAAAVGSEEGRVRVDLKVAPTSPVEFLTVTLVRAGGDLLRVGGS
jgi:hypothetical protein